MEEVINKNKIIIIKSELEGIDGAHKEIPITIMEDGTPRAVAFFDIDQTLAELKEIHGKAIKILFKEFFDKDFEDIEKVYFLGFKLGNSFREFDRMDGIYNLGRKEWINPEVYKVERLYEKQKEIDSDGFYDHKIAKMYLDRYVVIASQVADELYKNNKEEYEKLKIKPVFALVKYYKALGVPMFGMTANGRVLVKTLAKYLGLSDFFIDISTDEDMEGGGKEIIIPKLIEKLEKKGVKVSKEKLVVIGDSLSGDIGSGYKYKNNGEDIYIKGILVLKDMKEFEDVKKEIESNSKLRKIIENTDTEAFIVDNVEKDATGVPLISRGKENY
jgi:phosphoglycolate phosphatase-like HAD superfamily hydrolase